MGHEATEMLKIKIYANSQLLRQLEAVNVSKRYGKGTQTYEINDFQRITHEYEDGYLILAKKMIEHEIERVRAINESNGKVVS